MKPFLTVLGQKYSSYNIAVMAGIVLAFCLFCKFEKSISSAEKDDIISIMGLNLAAGFVSAVLGDKLLHFHSWNDFREHLFRFTGMTFICGLIGGFVFFIVSYGIACRDIRKIYPALNAITPYFITAQMFGRFGCLMGGCCFGRPSDSAWCIRYPQNSYAFQVYGDKQLYPFPVMEICLLLLILIFTVKVFRNARFICYILMYTSGRFFLEYFRGDNRGNMYGSLSPSQGICMLLFITVIFVSGVYACIVRKKFSFGK